MRSKMLSAALLTAVLVALGWAPAQASTPLVTEAWQVDAWSIEEGLPASTVTAIAPTADGRLWLGTFAGLSRFDGQRIDPVGEPSDDSPVRITALAPDGEAVWIGTESEGLWRLEEGACTRVETPSAVVRHRHRARRAGSGRVALAQHQPGRLAAGLRRGVGPGPRRNALRRRRRRGRHGLALRRERVDLAPRGAGRDPGHGDGVRRLLRRRDRARRVLPDAQGRPDRDP
ncbi:MAG: hypothetical protein GY913_22155 [Proteobacteria bacterium]|nr:hypothetical protein [Pseudomonadota bacterium]MCP4919615.1 hypothetical protein [Pseudomonadota bacterium]